MAVSVLSQEVSEKIDKMLVYFYDDLSDFYRSRDFFDCVEGRCFYFNPQENCVDSGEELPEDVILLHEEYPISCSVDKSAIYTGYEWNEVQGVYLDDPFDKIHAAIVALLERPLSEMELFELKEQLSEGQTTHFSLVCEEMYFFSHNSEDIFWIDVNSPFHDEYLNFFFDLEESARVVLKEHLSQ